MIKRAIIYSLCKYFNCCSVWQNGILKKVCRVDNKCSVYTGVADYPIIISTFKYVIYENVLNIQDRKYL